MNTRRLTKKYKHKSRSKKSKRRGRTRRRGRRVLKGGVPSVRPRPSSGRPSARPIGFVVRKTSGASARPSSASIRPSVSGTSKPHNFNFECFYKKLMNTPLGELPSTIQDSRNTYIQATTLQNVKPKDSYPNMTGLKFVNYLRVKYKIADKKRDEETKTKIISIISLFDQCNMSQGARIDDLAIIKGQVDKRYYACYEKLYNDNYKKLFPNGNSDCFPVSTSAVTLYKTIYEDEDEDDK